MQIKKYVYRRLFAYGMFSFAFYLGLKAVFSYLFFLDFQNEEARYLSAIVADSLRPPVIQGP